MLQPVNYYTRLPDGGYLLIPGELLSRLHSYRQDQSLKSESGGVLIGLMRKSALSIDDRNLRHLELVDITVPSKDDERSRFGFFRRGLEHVQEVLQQWRDSQHTCCYLGEWHTHPELNPTPSSVDILQWKVNLKNKEAILIIVGIKSDWVAFWNGVEPQELGPLISELEH